jgi:cell division topological specificity factor
MSFMDYFKGEKKRTTANFAKERLQIIVAHERGGSAHLEYLPKLQQELLAVIRKYVQIEDDMVQVDIDRTDIGSVLELNVTLPEAVIKQEAEIADKTPPKVEKRSNRRRKNLQ